MTIQLAMNVTTGLDKQALQVIGNAANALQTAWNAMGLN
jgi:hypothetical protein